jgi:hypothetical protein
LRQKSNFANAINAESTVQPLGAKIFRSARRANHRYQLAPFQAREEGAFRDRHERWVRDAMDVAVHETNAQAADDEVVWS